jgi:hypothetical protein
MEGIDFNHRPKTYFDLAKLGYDDLGPQSLRDLEGWEVIDSYANPDTGYSAVAFKNPQGGVIFSHRGTEFETDREKDLILADMDIVNDKIPKQYHDAEKFVERVFENEKASLYIEHTGHSLGGALSQMIAHKYDSKAVAFDPPGTKEIIAKIPSLAGDISHEKFQTYVVDGSLVSMTNNHVGTITRISVPTDGRFLGVDWKFNNHKMKNIEGVFDESGEIQDLSILDELNPIGMQRIKEAYIRNSIDRLGEPLGNVRDTIHFSKDVINKMSEIGQQLKESYIGVPVSNQELEEVVPSEENTEIPEGELQSLFSLADDLESSVAALHYNLSAFQNIANGI